MKDQHVLQEIKFPARYERLVEALGPDVARVLVPPDKGTAELMEAVASAVVQNDEGLLCPLFADAGTGKTTLAQNLESFEGRRFGPTLLFEGESISSAGLSAAVRKHRGALMAANDSRVTPVNIDSREARPPDAGEMSELKHFLRTNEGAKTAILWPTTRKDVADEISSDYRRIVGDSPVPLPLEVKGPPQESWRQIAADTLRVVNDVDSLETLLNVDDFEPDEFDSVGSFLRALSKDFMKRRLEISRSLDRRVSMTIVFASESIDHGILSQLCSSTRYGLLDGNALIGVTKGSGIGKWWDARRGLLTHTIILLNAHAFALAPSTCIAILRQYGPDAVKSDLAGLGLTSKGEAACITSVKRSDLGRHLAGEQRSAFETRGNPGDTSATAFSLLAENGHFANNRDRLLNKSVAKAIQAFVTQESEMVKVSSESKMAGTNLIPDVSLSDDESAHGVEFAWRSRNYLVSQNRSACAQYILTKLKNYAVDLGLTGSE